MQGTNQLPFGFLPKKQEPTVASCKTKTPRKRIRNCFILPLLKTSLWMLNDAKACYWPVMCIQRCTSQKSHSVKYLAGDRKGRRNQPVTFTLQEFSPCSIYTWSNSGSERHHMPPWHEMIKISRLCKVARKAADVWKKKRAKTSHHFLAMLTRQCWWASKTDLKPTRAGWEDKTWEEKRKKTRRWHRLHL